LKPTLYVTLATLLFAVSGAASTDAQDVLTWHNDNARTGQDLTELTLTLQNVNDRTFGKLFVIHVDGKVDAEPLYVHQLELADRELRNVLYVATEHDSLYAFDADTGEPFWHAGLLGRDETPSDNRNCGQVSPEIGITSTPVIDRHRAQHGVIYVVAMSKDSQGRYMQKLHALDLRTGAEKFNGPVEIRATSPGTGAVSNAGTEIFDPKQYEERAALLLENGIIYTSWASHCDIDPYNGWVIGYSAQTLKQTAVLNFTPNGKEGAIWQSGAGPAADPEGNIYLLAANGTFDTELDSKGFPSRGDFGNAFLKLSASGGRLSVADYFATFDVVKQSDLDGDLGSSGPLILPEMKDASGKTWRLAVGAGKDRTIYVVNRDAMGKFTPQENRIYQELDGVLKGNPLNGTRGAAAYFDRRLYYGALNQPIREFRFVHARLLAEPVSQSSLTYIYPGATPSISANGTRNGILWATENTNPVVLHAYAATDLSRELYNSNQAPSGRDHFGSGNKFITPMIANGKVYVGTTDGVGVFGLRKDHTIGAPLARASGASRVGLTRALRYE
jgi:outer membrane protein assembly factor BamB